MKKIIITTVVAATLSISSVSFAKDKNNDLEKEKLCYGPDQVTTETFRDNNKKARRLRN